MTVKREYSSDDSLLYFTDEIFCILRSVFATYELMQLLLTLPAGGGEDGGGRSRAGVVSCAGVRAVPAVV